MTIPATEPKKITAPGNGVATVFSFSPMNIFAATDLQVTRVVIATGVETLLTQGSGAGQYLITDPTTFPGTAVTGSITYPSSGTILPATEKLVMKSLLPLEQQTDLENQGGYFPDTQETQFDKNLKVSIQQQEEIDRSLRLPVSTTGVSVELPVPVADRLLGWNATATAIVNKAGAGTLTTTAFTESLLDDTGAEQFRDTLNADLTKGDLVIGNGSGSTQLGVGTNELPLVAASAEATGLIYKVLTVTGGGSGAATLTGILVGNGTSAFTTVTAPSGALVGDTDTQILSGKTLTSPIINTPTISAPVITTASGAAPAQNTIFSDTICNAWARVSGTATPVLEDDFNIASVTDEAGTGRITFVVDTDFDDTDYCPVGTSDTNAMVVSVETTRFVGSFTTQTHIPAVGNLDAPLTMIVFGGVA